MMAAMYDWQRRAELYQVKATKCISLAGSDAQTFHQAKSFLALSTTCLFIVCPKEDRQLSDKFYLHVMHYGH